jgi:hypothetical protein
MTVNAYWVSKAETCSRCRWDEWFVEELISGHPKRPAGMPTVEHHEGFPGKKQDFGVVIFPAGAHGSLDVAWLNRGLAKLRAGVLIITSDEGATFPLHRVSHAHMHLWVMTPDPMTNYPPGTTFIGDGSARAWEHADPEAPKNLSWFFAGQVTNKRRKDCVGVLREMDGGVLIANTRFADEEEGLEREKYLELMSRAKVVPCPSGPDTQDTFRAYEAIELGSYPIVDGVRPDGGGLGYWWKCMDWPGIVLERWDDFPRHAASIETMWPKPIIHLQSWWHERRRWYAQRFMDQCPPTKPVETRDRMTVLIPTSPSPIHPDLSHIAMTVESIINRTDAEILIMCDGLHPSQKHLGEQYLEYLRRLMIWCEGTNVTPLVYAEHLHQAEMLRRTLEVVDTKYVMYVEHDTPLVNDIPIDEILDTMLQDGLNVMRFYHEPDMVPEHQWFMDPPRETGAVRYCPTMQWSQRPHIARRDFYERLLNEYFHPQARTMIEDVMYGVLDHHWRLYERDGWDRFRVGLYLPEGNIKRSAHLNGRGVEPKLGMRFVYPDGLKPEGAPDPSAGIV